MRKANYYLMKAALRILNGKTKSKIKVYQNEVNYDIIP